MKIKVTPKHDLGRMISKIESVPVKILRQADSIVNYPARKMVLSMKEQVKWDKEFNHIYKKNLFKNTRSELSAASMSRKEIKMQMEVGFFVPYGLNLELGSPPHDPGIAVMIDWASSKLRNRGEYTNKKAKEFGKRVRRKIRKFGSKSYPIVAQTFDAFFSRYCDDVFEKIAKYFKATVQ